MQTANKVKRMCDVTNRDLFINSQSLGLKRRIQTHQTCGMWIFYQHFFWGCTRSNGNLIWIETSIFHDQRIESGHHNLWSMVGSMFFCSRNGVFPSRGVIFPGLAFFCPRGVFLFRSVFLVPRIFFLVPGIGLSATGIGFLVPLGTFGARKGFSCARLKWNVLGCSVV